MQQSIYSGINGSGITIQATKTNETKTVTATRRVSLARRIAQRWDMVGVLALMASSAAYGVFAVAHVM